MLDVRIIIATTAKKRVQASPQATLQVDLLSSVIVLMLVVHRTVPLITNTVKSIDRCPSHIDRAHLRCMCVIGTTGLIGTVRPPGNPKPALQNVYAETAAKNAVLQLAVAGVEAKHEKIPRGGNSSKALPCLGHSSKQQSFLPGNYRHKPEVTAIKAVSNL